MSVLTLTQAKAYLKTTANDDDAELQATIDAAQAIVESRVGPLLHGGRTKVIDCLTGMLDLGGRAPLVSVDSIQGSLFYGSPSVNITYVVVDPAGFAYVPWWVRSYYQGPYTVAYTTGYGATVDDVPGDLVQALKELTRHLWASQRGSNAARPGPSPSETVPGAAYALPIRVEQILAAYDGPAAS